MKTIRITAALISVFAPFLMVGFLLWKMPNALYHITEGLDWTWPAMLGLMMVFLYYVMAVYMKEEEEIKAEFESLDRDHDGYISRDDAAGWKRLALAFDRFDSDHDGRMSSAEFDEFEHSMARP